MNEEQRSVAKQLISNAFAAARSKGRSDWRRMTLAVLKNRLLQLSDKHFSEADYGFQSFAEFARQFPELISIDWSAKPPMVELVESFESLTFTLPIDKESTLSEESTGARIRSDLWQAVMNYSVGSKFIWDPVEQVARTTDDPNASPLLPTIDANTLAQWRADFSANSEPEIKDDTQAIEKLRHWKERGLGTWALPSPLQGKWNNWLKSHVRRRLQQWFDEHRLPLPPDVLTRYSPSKAINTERRDTSTKLLRQLILDCVEVMTIEELSELRLPPAVLLRAQIRNRGWSPR